MIQEEGNDMKFDKLKIISIIMFAPFVLVSCSHNIELYYNSTRNSVEFGRLLVKNGERELYRTPSDKWDFDNSLLFTVSYDSDSSIFSVYDSKTFREEKFKFRSQLSLYEYSGCMVRAEERKAYLFIQGQGVSVIESNGETPVVWSIQDHVSDFSLKYDNFFVSTTSGLLIKKNRFTSRYDTLNVGVGGEISIHGKQILIISPTTVAVVNFDEWKLMKVVRKNESYLSGSYSFENKIIFYSVQTDNKSHKIERSAIEVFDTQNFNYSTLMEFANCDIEYYSVDKTGLIHVYLDSLAYPVEWNYKTDQPIRIRQYRTYDLKQNKAGLRLLTIDDTNWFRFH